MSRYNLQGRYRRRSVERVSGILIVLGTFALSFGLGFWVGGQVSGYQDQTLRSQMDKLAQEKESLQNTVTELRAETQTALARYAQLQKTYAEVLPEGPLRDLVGVLKGELAEGRDPARLAFLIKSARPPRNCTEAETKRFVVSTPAYKGTESALKIADGALVIKASGVSAMNGTTGKAEAWYDPTKAIKIEFTGTGGIKQTKSGIMPMTHSIVVEGREYRLTISESARSFAKVSFDSCDYP